MSIQTLSHPGDRVGSPTSVIGGARRRIPLRRIVAVELRKSFDTRAGLWLLASVGIFSLLTTGAVIAFSPDEDFTYSTFTTTIVFPMSVILPIIAALAVTAEWTQRSGLTTFTIVPHRGRIMLGKTIALVSVALPATALAFRSAPAATWSRQVYRVRARSGTTIWRRCRTCCCPWRSPWPWESCAGR